MNRNVDKINLSLEAPIYEPVKFRVELINRLHKKNISLKTINNEVRLEILIEQINLKTIFSLGYGICYTSYNWNKDIFERIKNRDELDFLGRKKFNGSDEEKYSLNNEDKSRIIDVDKDYFVNFIPRLLQRNIETFEIHDPARENIFRISLNFNNINKVVDYFNEKFKKDFIVLSVELDDQLDFATIGFKEAKLIDVFSLGFELCLADENINERVRNSQLNNSI